MDGGDCAAARGQPERIESGMVTRAEQAVTRAARVAAIAGGYEPGDAWVRDVLGGNFAGVSLTAMHVRTHPKEGAPVIYFRCRVKKDGGWNDLEPRQRVAFEVFVGTLRILDREAIAALSGQAPHPTPTPPLRGGECGGSTAP